jgi:hypothetical protein
MTTRYGRSCRRLFVAAAVALAATAGAQEKSRAPQGPPGTVTLPLPEYDRLVDRAAKPPKRPEQPPIAAVLARAEAHLRVGGDSVRGTLTLTGEVFRTGSTKVPLVTGATLLDARLAGRPLPLFHEGDAEVAVLGGPGPFVITLDWGSSLAAEPGRASFVLPVPASGSARATLEVPGEQADIRLTPGLITKRTAASGRTIVEATLDPGSHARFSWTAREGTATAPRETRFLSDIKTLVTVGEAELRLAVLVDVNVVQGSPERFALRLPRGFEIAGVSGSTLEKTEEGPGVLNLVVRDPARNRHQFLLTLERSSAGGSFQEEVPFPSVDGAQRETGEAAFESVGTMELGATERDDVRRMDVREASAALKGLARQPLLAAFRYHRKAGELPRVALDVKRFPDAAVLAAVAERAVVTTLVSAEGRTLTEVTLTVRNHAQPFLKVALPEGATLLSAEVAGEAVKPVKGDDGTRVPLLRAGTRPTGPYAVSFVYVHPGSPFAKRGQAAFALPRLDIPLSLVEWELFLPDRYKVSTFEGNALPVQLADVTMRPPVASAEIDSIGFAVAGSAAVSGRVMDESGAAIPGATITVTGASGARQATSGPDGSYVVYGVPVGQVEVNAALEGFKSARRRVRIGGGPARADLTLTVGSVSETISVEAESQDLRVGKRAASGQAADAVRGREANEPQQIAPSSNVFALQRRVAGVLPVRIDIPHAGASYRFVRPLVLEEETTVRFRYKAGR